MATKTANVTARVEPEIKEQAEQIMVKLGLPVSVVINAFYRQIVLNNGIPFSLSIPDKVKARDTVSDEEFNEMVSTGMEQAKKGNGVNLEDAASILKAGIRQYEL